MNKEQIDRLTYKPGRENIWCRYSHLSAEAQNYLGKAGCFNCYFQNHKGEPEEADVRDNNTFCFKDRYLLKPDYVPERETVEVGIHKCTVHWCIDSTMNGSCFINAAASIDGFKHYLWPNGDTSRYLEWEVTKDVKVVFWKD